MRKLTAFAAIGGIFLLSLRFGLIVLLDDYFRETLAAQTRLSAPKNAEDGTADKKIGIRGKHLPKALYPKEGDHYAFYKIFVLPGRPKTEVRPSPFNSRFTPLRASLRAPPLSASSL